MAEYKQIPEQFSVANISQSTTFEYRIDKCIILCNDSISVLLVMRIRNPFATFWPIRTSPFFSYRSVFAFGSVSAFGSISAFGSVSTFRSVPAFGSVSAFGPVSSFRPITSVPTLRTIRIPSVPSLWTPRTARFSIILVRASVKFIIIPAGSRGCVFSMYSRRFRFASGFWSLPFPFRASWALTILSWTIMVLWIVEGTLEPGTFMPFPVMLHLKPEYIQH